MFPKFAQIHCAAGFSALQRAEIAEIVTVLYVLPRTTRCFSALQRAEIAEIVSSPSHRLHLS